MVSGAHFLPILRHRLSGLVRKAHGTIGSPDSGLSHGHTISGTPKRDVNVGLDSPQSLVRYK